MESPSEPRAIQILDFTEDDVHLNHNALRSVLEHEHLQSIPLVVVSIAGALRTGKSFLLNFFLRYLRRKGWRNGNWMEGFGTDNDSGFDWKGGVDAQTKGIYLWNEVFLVDADEGTQNKVAILLMDTQGLFESSVNQNVNRKILTISLLMSSVEIFNVKNQIQENDLEFLRFFAEYARVSSEESVLGVQKLIFLVRDWQNEIDYDFGEEGGKRYMEYQLAHPRNNSSSTYMEGLRKVFKNIHCFLLPYPIGCQMKEFRGMLHQIEEEFQNEVESLVTSILHPNNLLVKTIRGEISSVRLLLNHVTAVYSIDSRSSSMPKVTTMAQAYIKSSCWEHYLRALERYEEIMDQKFFPSIDGQTLQSCHDSAKSDVRIRFKNECPFMHRQEGKRFMTRLDEAIDNQSLSKYQGLITIDKARRRLNDALCRVRERKSMEKEPTKDKRVSECIAKFKNSVNEYIEESFFEFDVEDDSKDMRKFDENQKDLDKKCRDVIDEIISTCEKDSDEIKSALQDEADWFKERNAELVELARMKGDLLVETFTQDICEKSHKAVNSPGMNKESYKALQKEMLDKIPDVGGNGQLRREVEEKSRESNKKDLAFLESHSETIVNGLAVTGAVVGFCGLLPFAGAVILAGGVAMLTGALGCKLYKSVSKKKNDPDSKPLLKEDDN